MNSRPSPAATLHFMTKKGIISRYASAIYHVGVWRSWLARLLWEQEAGGSSPLTPTNICGYRIAIIMSAFQAEDEGLIPSTRSKCTSRSVRPRSSAG